MRIKKAIAGVTAAAAALAGGVALAGPAQATGYKSGKTITETAVALSGGSKAGIPDRRSWDFDIAVAALGLTGLDEVLNDRSAKYTVVLPTDGAFIRSANELGANVRNEAQAIEFYVGLGVQTVSNVLLYHVVPGSQSYNKLKRAGDVDTALKVLGGVQDATFDAKRRVIVDQLDRKAFVFVKNLPAQNGKINVIGKVILPGLPG